MARVMYRNPEIIILDEPTSSLDPSNKTKIYEFLKEMHGKKTLVIVSHEMELIDYSDFVLQIDRGQVTFQGKASNFQIPGN